MSAPGAHMKRHGLRLRRVVGWLITGSGLLILIDHALVLAFGLR